MFQLLHCFRYIKYVFTISHLLQHLGRSLQLLFLLLHSGMPESIELFLLQFHLFQLSCMGEVEGGGHTIHGGMVVHDRNGNRKRVLKQGLLLFEGVHGWGSVEDEFVVG